LIAMHRPMAESSFGTSLDKMSRGTDTVASTLVGQGNERYAMTLRVQDDATVRVAPVDVTPITHPVGERPVHAPTLLESDFPVSAVGQKARHGRRRPDPVYGAHKWWARRPPESIRALLIAASLPAGAEEEFWRRFDDDADLSYADARVADPFLGGGTSLVEAQRLGAAVYGMDVDPLAAMISEHELTHLDTAEFTAAADQLIAHLTPLVEQLYPPRDETEEPLHYFYLREVECPSCATDGLLYKSLVLARDVGKNGGVVRGGDLAAFCPACHGVQQIPAARKQLDCCGRRFKLASGSYDLGKYTCSACGQSSTHEQLKTGMRRRILIAVEVTRNDKHRLIRTPTEAESDQSWEDDARLADQYNKLVLPDAPFQTALRNHKPGVYGFESFASLFSPRQLLVFGSAFRWLSDQAFSVRIRSALALAVSNALASNNLLCAYATDYGRLAPLFSVRDYSLPVLSVELNPLHATAGRGTLRATIRRVAASKGATGDHDTRDSSVQVADATTTAWPDAGGFDVVMTDPPYFDYIAYSDLSQFFRAWLDAAGLSPAKISGDPLYEGRDSRATFATRLGATFKNAADRLKPNGVLVFTYHATTAEGWQAAVDAIRRAGLSVTEAFPLWADAKSPGHGHAGNIEFDVVFCCRPATVSGWTTVSADKWAKRFGDEKIADTEVAAWRQACEQINAVQVDDGARHDPR